MNVTSIYHNLPVKTSKCRYRNRNMPKMDGMGNLYPTYQPLIPTCFPSSRGVITSESCLPHHPRHQAAGAAQVLDSQGEGNHTFATGDATYIPEI